MGKRGGVGGYLVVLLCLLVCRLSWVGGTPDNDENEDIPSTRSISIVLLGRKGSGITSTLRQLLGPTTIVHAAEEAVASTDVLEYTLRIPAHHNNSSYDYLRLIDVPGLELGDNLEHDAEILSTLKSYLHDQGIPTFFVVVFRADDHTIAEPNSPFSQLLRSVEFLQKSLFQATTDNTLFLLTRIFNEPKDVQANPGNRIKEFENVIKTRTSLPTDRLAVVVGDNKPGEVDGVQGGFVKLGNGELYPKNLIERMMGMRSNNHAAADHHVGHVLQVLVDGRESLNLHAKELVAHASDEEVFENDLEAFEYLLRQESLELPAGTEVQTVLRNFYNRQDVNTQVWSSVQLRALQVSLRNLKVDSIGQLPQTSVGLVQLFQGDVDGVMTSKYSLYYLRNALNLDVPEYPSEALVVGNGYDVIHDRVLKKSPFVKNNLNNKRPSSSLGYQFPDFIECERLADVEERKLANVSVGLAGYYAERLRLLTFPGKELVKLDRLQQQGGAGEGLIKSYLNYNYKETGKLVAVQETRMLECKMTVENDTLAIMDESFITQVGSLGAFNASDAASVRTWKLLLHSFGTHVITKTYGGGCYEGVLNGVGQDVQPEDALRLLDNILAFENLNKNGSYSLVYRFHLGDEIDPRASRIDELDAAKREIILNNWAYNLNLKFEMFDNEMELVPLSQVVGIVDPSKQADAEVATTLLLQGTLESSVEEGSRGARLSDDDMRAKAYEQARLLRKLNLEKENQKLARFNEFVDEASSTRE